MREKAEPALDALAGVAAADPDEAVRKRAEQSVSAIRSGPLPVPEEERQQRRDVDLLHLVDKVFKQTGEILLLLLRSTERVAHPKLRPDQQTFMPTLGDFRYITVLGQVPLMRVAPDVDGLAFVGFRHNLQLPNRTRTDLKVTCGRVRSCCR